MLTISIPLASTLTGLSERTLWRRVSDGSVRRGAADAGRATVLFADIIGMLVVPFGPDDMAMIASADAGDLESINSIALDCIEAGRPREAVRLLEQAAKAGHPDSMAVLGRCYIDGAGVDADQITGLSWITRAAAAGHLLSTAVLSRMVSGAIAHR